jgi:hypothetical protein
MGESSEELFRTAFGPESGTGYRLSRALASAFRGKAIVEGLSDPFDLDEYATAGKCVVKHRISPHGFIATDWSRSHGLSRSTETAVADVTWEGDEVVVARARWSEGWSTKVRHWVIADDEALARRFADAVSAYCNEPHDAVLTFAGGCWSKSHTLWKEIQSASFDELVLAGNLGEEIRDDFASFMAAREEYVRYGVPWKRGVLFLGPPGNGKTHCLRAVIKFLGVSCLYVQSLKSKYETDDANIAKIFARAHEVTPCCLVFEDLDAMITDENRSVFLNQLDGFANASGLLTLATTNHPENLDAAILERPSRFDRKYTFALPSAMERERYAQSWSARLDPAMRISVEQSLALVEATHGFSFAYLKELFLSSMIRWMKTRESGTMSRIIHEQLAILRSQMTAEPVVAVTRS